MILEGLTNLLSTTRDRKGSIQQHRRPPVVSDYYYYRDMTEMIAPVPFSTHAGRPM